MPTPLVLIKLVHTAVWFFFAACILAVPITAAMHNFAWTAAFAGVVFLECAILGVNRGRCPLTDLAARYTSERHSNFDIYLPLWLARHNKAVFGTIYVLSLVYAFLEWRGVSQ